MHVYASRCSPVPCHPRTAPEGLGVADSAGGGSVASPPCPSSPSLPPGGVGHGGEVDGEGGGSMAPEPSSVPVTLSDTNTSSNATQRWSSCLPGSAVLRRFRRRGGMRDGGVALSLGGSASAESGSLEDASDDGNSSVGAGSTRSMGRMPSSKRSWRRPKGRNHPAKCVRQSSKSSTHWVSIEEAEALAVKDWGDQGSGGMGSARDVWKELSPPGGGGKSAGNGGRAGSTASSAVRLRLRFVPLWDCLTVGCLVWVASSGSLRLSRQLSRMPSDLCSG